MPKDNRKDTQPKKWYKDPKKLAIGLGTGAALGIGGYYGYKALKDAGYDIPRLTNIVKQNLKNEVQNFDPRDYYNPIVQERPKSLLGDYAIQWPVRKKQWYEKIF